MRKASLILVAKVIILEGQGKGGSMAMAADATVHVATDSQVVHDKAKRMLTERTSKMDRKPSALQVDGDLWKTFAAHMEAKGQNSMGLQGEWPRHRRDSNWGPIRRRIASATTMRPNLRGRSAASVGWQYGASYDIMPIGEIVTFTF